MLSSTGVLQGTQDGGGMLKHIVHSQKPESSLLDRTLFWAYELQDWGFQRHGLGYCKVLRSNSGVLNSLTMRIFKSS